jgi:TPR repeat protein
MAVLLQLAACAGAHVPAGGADSVARPPAIEAVAPAGHVLGVSMGASHACAILERGALKCWGDNANGQLGLGDAINHGERRGQMGANLPSVDLGPGRSALSVSAGRLYTCALLDDHSVKCWGAAGLGSVAKRGTKPGQMGANLAALNLGPGRSALAVHAGDTHACVLLDDHSIKCWGPNGSGELGVGDTRARGAAPGRMSNDLPAVDLGPGRSALAVSPGAAHTCALLDDHSVKCWGAKTAIGVAGPSNRGDKPGEMGANLPAVDLGRGRHALMVSTRVAHTCAVLDDHSVKCWGINRDGELGLGDVKDRGPGPLDMGDNLPAIDLGPGRSAVAVSAGENYTCALFDDHSVKCWGANAGGQLGLGDTTNRGDKPGEMGASLPAVDFGPGRSAVAISAGDGNTCAVLDDQSIKCWGANGAYRGGTLGLGDAESRGNKPAQMGANLRAVKLRANFEEAIVDNQACDGGDAAGCDKLGSLYQEGEDTGRRLDQAKALFGRACDAGNRLGCEHLGGMYLRGEGGRKDPEQAAWLYKKGCRAGDLAACTALGRLFTQGEGVIKSSGQAAAWFKSACDGGDRVGCDNLAWLYAAGDGVTKDLSLATTLYKRACDAGERHACENLAATAAEQAERLADARLSETPDYTKLEIAVDAPDGSFGLGSGCGVKGFANVNERAAPFAAAAARELARHLGRVGFHVVTTAGERSARAKLQYVGLVRCSGKSTTVELGLKLLITQNNQVLSSAESALESRFGAEATAMARPAVERLVHGAHFERSKKLMHALGAKAAPTPDLCKLEATHLLNSGYYLRAVAAISPEPRHWSVLVDVRERVSEQPNAAVRVVSVVAGASLLEASALEGCLPYERACSLVPPTPSWLRTRTSTSTVSAFSTPPPGLRHDARTAPMSS